MLAPLGGLAGLLLALAPGLPAQEGQGKDQDPGQGQGQGQESGQQDAGPKSVTDTSWADTFFSNPSLMPGWMGRSQRLNEQLGQTTGFDNRFNPAVGVVIDTVAEFSDLNGADVYGRTDSARVRTVELDFASVVDPFGWAYVVAAFEDNGAESEIGIEEAAVWFTNLPDTFSFRSGKYLADFDKWNPIHAHDLPFMFQDSVRTEFFGGNLNMTGMELHHWFGLGDVPVRWSLGIAGQSQTESPDADPLANPAVEPFGTAGIEDTAYSGRVTGQHDISDNGFFQWGVSGFYTGTALEEQEVPAGGGTIQEASVRNAVVALDFTLRDVDATDLTSHTVTVEFWRQSGQFIDPTTGGILSSPHNGVWGFYEHAFNPRVSAGVQAAWVEHRNSPDGGEWFTGGMAEGSRALYTSYNFSDFHRLRFQITQTNPGAGQPSYYIFGIQWTVIMGPHAHGIDW